MFAARVILASVVLLRGTCAAVSAPVPEPVRFNRDIRPILSENCFYCHGQDSKHREADLRLDLSEEATRLNNGVAAVVPGKPEAGEMILRLLSKEDDEVMPPPKAHKNVTPEQIALLKRWISEGANYEKHWSFIPPNRAPLPEVKNPGWVRTELDRFILGRLENEGISPAVEATPEAWLRRASFDLTGLAPSPVELDAFAAEVAGKGESAYESAADRLLGSSRFGERLAQEWLDAARYADTHGFNNDTARSMWRWRDWVIDAFNENKPYDQFLTEQFAGDLLPQPTLEQRIATGFGRNHVINSEGGIIDEEYRVEYVVDRVRTLGMSTLGLTLECARCHDHKFDPITQKNYYEFFAFFNQVPELGEDGRVANASPFIAAPTREQQAAYQKLDEKIVEKTALLEGMFARDREMHGDPETSSRLKEFLKDPVAAPESPKLVLGKQSSAELANMTAREDVALGSVFTFEGTSAGPVLDGKIVDFNMPWTLSTWLRWSGGEAVVCSTQGMQMSPTSAEYGKGIAVRITEEGRIEVRSSFRWPGYAAQVISREKIAADQLQQVTVSADGSGKAAGIRIFINAVECGNEIRHDGMTTNARYFSTGDGKLRIGAEDAKESRRFRGELAGFRIYQKAVAPDEFRPWVETTLARDGDGKDQPEWLRDFLLRRSDREYERIWTERDRLRDQRRGLDGEVPSTMVVSRVSP